jgi:hypothetical protein
MENEDRFNPIKVGYTGELILQRFDPLSLLGVMFLARCFSLDVANGPSRLCV